MRRSPENAPAFQAGVQVEKSPEKTTVRGECYALTMPSGKPYLELCDHEGNQWVDLSFVGRIDSNEQQDETYSIESPDIQIEEDSVVIRVKSHGTAWIDKEQVWTCKNDGIEMHYEVTGHGNITRCEMLGGFMIGHKNGTYPSQKYFTKVFNPEPTFSEKPIRSASHTSHLNVTGAFRTGNKDGQFTPAPWYYALQQNNASNVLTMSLASPIEDQNFTSFDYVPYEDSFFFRLDYQSHTAVNGVFRSPTLLMRFADDPYQGIHDYREKLRSLNLLPTVAKNNPVPWHGWSRYCGWGAQVRAASLHPGSIPQAFSTQEFYESRRQDLASHDIWLPVVTIDHGWTESHGTLHADPQKWNLDEWVEELHCNDQKVLMHYKMWDPEGVDPDFCIKGPDDKPVAVDPTHPGYHEFIRERIRFLLGPDGYNADGIKTDFSGDIPNGHFYKTYGDAWGSHLQHLYYKMIYDYAKEAKADALIITHAPNPQYADTTDSLRLNDINHHRNINRQMRHRAKVARAAIPHALIDTDNWPFESAEQWRRYMKIQPRLGVVAFYDNYELAEPDYALLRAVGFSR